MSQKHLRVQWIHSIDKEPTQILIEVDEQLREVRKIEFFRNGTKTFADQLHSTGETLLSVEPIPEVATIRSDPQFEVTEISALEFDQEWSNRSD